MSVTTSGHTSILRPQNFGELLQFATYAAKSSMVPTNYRGKPEDIVLAVQMGSEVGLSPMQSIQNIAVINGRPCIWGDALPGLCRASPLCEDIVEVLAGEGDQMIATCTATRRGVKPVIRTFSVTDAKKAGLWNKAGPWQQYPQRMLPMRARGWALRDAFPDVLKGLISVEEAVDSGDDGFRGVTINAAASREEINKAVPLHVDEPMPAEPVSTSARRTWREWLDEIEPVINAAADEAALITITDREDVQKALAIAPDVIKARLNEVMADAIARTAPPPEEEERMEV